MKPKHFFIIVIIIFLIFLFTKQILNLVLFIGKKYYLRLSKDFIKYFDLSENEIKINYKTYIYDLKLYINNLETSKNYIYFNSLNEIEINLDNVNGYFKFKFYIGIKKIGDDLTINFENLNFKYQLEINSYFPLYLKCKNPKFEINYDIKNENILGKILKIGVNAFKEKINENLINKLKTLPDFLKTTISDYTDKKKFPLLKSLEVYTYLYNKLWFN